MPLVEVVDSRHGSDHDAERHQPGQATADVRFIALRREVIVIEVVLVVLVVLLELDVTHELVGLVVEQVPAVGAVALVRLPKVCALGHVGKEAAPTHGGSRERVRRRACSMFCQSRVECTPLHRHDGRSELGGLGHQRDETASLTTSLGQRERSAADGSDTG